MKLIDTRNAVGHILCHDLTQIIPGVTKEARFRKGHVVCEADIPVLLSMGKEHLSVWEQQPGMLHENDAAMRLAALCKAENMRQTEPKEGKIEILAECDGLFCVNADKLEQINLLGDIMIATRHSYFPVRKGDKLAGTRVIPLIIDEKKLQQAEELVGDVPLLTLMTYHPKKTGIVTTGSEVYSGRIQDAFGPVVKKKLEEYGVQVMGHRVSDDDPERTRAMIQAFLDEGAELVVCTGGMSVDPDDRTPAAIRATGARIVSYGAPVLPGAMFLLSYYGKENIPIVGLPGCVMYAKRTIFDIILPRLLAECPVEKADLARLGQGGLCLNCEPCHYPNCSFGK